MSRADVVVTGLGATSPLGGDVAASWAAALAGRSGVIRFDDWSAGEPIRFGARLAVEPSEMLPARDTHRLDRVEQIALVAARAAWADAGLSGRAADNGLDPTRVAVAIGSCIGGVTSLLQQHQVYLDRGPNRVSPLMIPQNMPNGPAAYVSIDLDAQAGAFAPSSACATGAEAIAYGADLIALDRADIVVVGGAEACIHPLTMAGFAQARAMSRRNDDPVAASRPFDRDRDGFVIGEGAGLLVLERRSTAVARGARIYARVAGSAVTADAHHITAPDPGGSGQRRAMELSLHRSGLSAADVVHVNAHATSTPRGDIGEARAIADVLGTDTVVTSTKGMTGHLLGAAGALEAIFTVLAVRDGVVPPTINLGHPDPDLRVPVPTAALQMPIPAALSNSFGFGGHNASLLFAAS
jgi:3-oxoacyl-[acyl-carrier-protein] synthase II